MAFLSNLGHQSHGDKTSLIFEYDLYKRFGALAPLLYMRKEAVTFDI